MAREVEIASGKSNVQLPNGGVYQAGDTVVLTDAQYAQINQALIPGTVIDNGVVEGVEDEVVTQAANIAAVGALTSAAPAALTSSAPAALTSAAITGGESPTEAEHNTLRTDVAALRTTLAAVQADLATARTERAAVQTDLATLRTKVNAILSGLTGSGLPIAAP